MSSSSSFIQKNTWSSFVANKPFKHHCVSNHRNILYTLKNSIGNRKYHQLTSIKSSLLSSTTLLLQFNNKNNYYNQSYFHSTTLNYFSNSINMKSSTHKSVIHPSPLDKFPRSFLDTSIPDNLRDDFKLRGILPPAHETLENQMLRVISRLREKSRAPLAQFEYLSELRFNQPHLFYRVLMDNFKELNPLVYTPVVGEACQRFSHIYTHPEGLHLSIKYKGHIREILDNYPADDIRICVVTDGSRILGLGDLGLNGMGIPIGKLSLYVACCGIHPFNTLPIVLDYGTNNEEFLNDPLYLGLREHRRPAEECKEFVREFMAAVHDKWPKMLIQFEDFSTEMAFELLDEHRYYYPCFNDDIQGTGAVILAGVINAIKLSGKPLAEHKLVFLGAGSAGVGVVTMIHAWISKQGISEEDARKMFYLVDSKGLIAHNRGDKLPEHKLLFARSEEDCPKLESLEEVVKFVNPTALLGLSTVGSAFTEPIIRHIAETNERPIVFPLSNPISKSECTFQEAVDWTDGRCLFASGSPFTPLIHNGKTLYPGQGNNMYVFPPLGLGAIISGAKQVTDGMLHTVAEALSASLNDEEKADSLLYPHVERVRDVSTKIASKIIRQAQTDGVDTNTELRNLNDDELLEHIKSTQYDPYVANWNFHPNVTNINKSTL